MKLQNTFEALSLRECQTDVRNLQLNNSHTQVEVMMSSFSNSSVLPTHMNDSAQFQNIFTQKGLFQKVCLQ